MRYSRTRDIGRLLIFILGSSASFNNYCCATKEMNLVRSIMAGARRHPSPSSVFIRMSPQTIIPAFTTRSTVHPGTNIHGPSEKIMYNDQASKQNNDRRQLGAMHSFQRKKSRHLDNNNNNMVSPLMATPEDESTPPITQYTINDSTCPPTDPEILKKTVLKHINTLPKYWESRPIAKHTAAAFEEALEFVIQCGPKSLGASSSSLRTKVILDSGCGTGKSSYLLGEMHPDCVVIGIDQSLARLSRNKSYNQHDENNNDDSTQQENSNVLLIRAELSDFWKCCLSSSRWQEHVQIYRHYLLYPNPYPKKSRLKSRFYAHPAFPLLMMTLMMGDEDDNKMQSMDGKEKLVIRSNWKGYLEEFQSAVGVWQENEGNFMDFSDKFDDWQVRVSPVEWETIGPKRLDIVKPLTNFEAKYLQVGEPVYELSVLNALRK
mmetsp:Transcript_30537/g.64640  ORF Transcript_30537/g.64640 Transcript_30537/m.64640 type:complete len:433 (-) Transcript_30537:40-1338(-)